MSCAEPGGQPGGSGGSVGGAPEREPRRERAERGLPPGARRLGGRPARELEQGRRQRRHGIEDGGQQLEPLVRPGLDRDDDRGPGPAAEGNADPLARGELALQLERHAVRERAGNGKVEDDVREQEGRPQAPAGARPRTRSYSRRMSFRSSYAWRRYAGPGLRKRNAG